MIPITNKAACVCIKQWVFNKTEDFDGVIFEVCENYIVDLGGPPNSNLWAVFNMKQNAYVGINKQRFAECFRILGHNL